MAAPTFKKATDTCAGNAAKYGAPDVKYAFDVLDATHATDRIQASVVETTSCTNVQTSLDGKALSCHTHLLIAGATDVTITAANLNILDNGVDTTLHFHASDRARVNHTGTQLKSTISDFAHKVDHVAGGSDTFVKNDVLAVASRYLDDITDPTSDAQNIWLTNTGSEIRYWDDLATPVKRTVVTTDLTQTLTNKSIGASQLTGIVADARMPDLTGDVTTVEGAVATTIGAGKVTDAMLVSTFLKNIIEDTTPQLGGALDGQGNDLNNMGVLFLTEQADAEVDVAGKGQIWVNLATPNELFFTDDVGTDFQVAHRQNNLSVFATTTSAQLAGVINDETGSGLLVFGTSPTLITPALGTPASGVATNLTGTSGITGLGVQTQDLDMDGNDIILDVAGNIHIDNSVVNVTKLKHSSNFPNFALLRDQIVADGSTAGKISFRSKDDGGSERIFGEIRTIIEDTTVAGNLVHGSLHIRVRDANVETTYISLNDAKSGQIDILKNLNINGNQIINTGTLTLPTSTDTLTGRATTDTLTNKTIDGDDNTIIDINETQMNVSVGAATTVLTSNGVGSPPSYAAPTGGEFTATWTANHNNGGSTFALEDALFADPTDDTKQLQIDLAGMTTSVIAILDFNFTTAKTITFPDVTDTLAVKGANTFTATQNLGGNDIDMGTTGARIDLDTDNDTSIRASADDVITFETGTNDFFVVRSGQVDFETSGSAGLANMTRQDATTFKLFELVFNGDSSTGVKRQFGKLIVSSPVNTNAIEDGKFAFNVRENGVDTEYLSMNAQAGHIFFRKPISVPANTKILLDGASAGNTSIRGEVAGDDIIFETAGADQWTILSNGDLEHTNATDISPSGVLRLGANDAIRFDLAADQMEISANGKQIGFGLVGTQPAAGSKTVFGFFEANSSLDIDLLVETGDGTSVILNSRPAGGTVGSTGTVYESRINVNDDTGSRATTEFVALRDTGGLITTRPLFEWLNHTTLEMSLTVNGDLNLESGNKFQENTVNISPIGVHDIPISATSMYLTSNTPATGLTDTNFATNDIDIKTFDFTSTTADETVQFRTGFPRNYNNGAITVTIKYSFASGTGDVVWRVGAVATGDNDAIDATMTFSADLIDTVGTANQVQSVTTASFTPGGTPADADELHFEIMRQGSDAVDTFSGTARLHSIVIHMTTDTATAA